MAVLLSVYLDRKALLYDFGVAAICVNLALRYGFIALPEQITSLDTIALLSTGLITIVALCLGTRIYSGRKQESTEKSETAVLPYWIPVLGHLPQFAFGGERFLKSAREASVQDSFALNLAGIKHTIIDNPALIDAISKKETDVLDRDELATTLRRNVFGFSVDKTDTTPTKSAALSDAFYENIFSKAQAEDMLNRTMNNFKDHLPNLVSFLPSLVDQALWERVSDTNAIETAGGKQFAETNLLSLMRELIGQSINSAYAGTAFFEGYSELHSDLRVLDNSFSVLATGLPRWVPIPRLPAGYIARKRLLERLEGLENNFDTDEVSLLFKTTHDLLEGENVAAKQRASVDLSFMWALNASACNLAFWLLVHIASQPQILKSVRDEISPFAQAVQPPNDFGLPEPPRLQLAMDKLETQCPLFMSCYAETVRLYDTAWAVKKVKQDFTVSEPQMKHRFTKGEYIDVSRRLRQTSNRFVSNASDFKPDRFVKVEEAGKAPKMDWGEVRNCQGMWEMGDNMLFAQRACLAFVAGVLAMWELEPVDRAGWKMPGVRQGAFVASPKSDVRVRLSRRRLP